MDKLTCERCGHIFKYKSYYHNHLNRKRPCVKKLEIHEKGQYFTTNEYLKQCVLELIINDSKLILEPSIGQGDLVDYVLREKKGIEFHLYEIDENIQLLESINRDKVIYGDFLKQAINEKYNTIIGNPPYVKTKTGNLYLEFIDKCYELLNLNGELIFIVPSDFIKLTSSGKIINKMMENGTFTHIIHPNNESLFSNASIDVIIFRYCKNKTLSKKIVVNSNEKYLININGILTFSDIEPSNINTFAEYFDIFVGMVTGKESVYKNDKFGNITILNGKDKVDNYILLEQFPTDNLELNKYMLSYKNELITRKIKKFTEKNWFEWGALRNYNTIKKNIGKDCIYVSTMSRSNEICFKTTVQYFGGGLIIMIPKQKINLTKIVEYINSDSFKSNYMYSGRFKIGHKQLCNALFNIPSYF